MYPLKLTQRTNTLEWNRETQQDTEITTDTAIYVNPELIEFVAHAIDAPNKYRSHVRMHSGWDLFVLESPRQIDEVIKAARYSVLLERAIEKP